MCMSLPIERVQTFFGMEFYFFFGVFALLCFSFVYTLCRWWDCLTEQITWLSSNCQPILIGTIVHLHLLCRDASRHIASRLVSLYKHLSVKYGHHLCDGMFHIKYNFSFIWNTWHFINTISLKMCRWTEPEHNLISCCRKMYLNHKKHYVLNALSASTLPFYTSRFVRFRFTLIFEMHTLW